MAIGYVLQIGLLLIGLVVAFLVPPSKHDGKIIVSTIFVVLILIVIDFSFFNGTALMKRLAFTGDSPLKGNQLDYFSVVVGFALGKFVMKLSDLNK